MSDNLRAIAESRVERKIKFKRNLYSYIVVNVILAIVNIIFTPEYWWFLWVVLFWGIGVLVDFLRAYVLMDKFDTDEYRERKIQEEMEKLRD
ncbi:MAG: 2TM domain-containing protein [Methanobrevibacter sp.]|uniref:2TM domain-containing protein n=1 Tax=Methanobrevibacter sp. TaxID=66852 RepID=UPI0025D168F7|nr:2TM domain-containing protein [Methanobrevibacter sp.]MBQ8016558.1 2TM domain-containing protein [Methanobrevibacter sp.]